MGSHHPIRKTVAPETPIIPDKLYFRIGDVARLCDVPAYVLRFWETEFPNLKPNKGGTGQRLYRKREVELALRIKSLLYQQGYTIPGARQILKSEPRPHPAETSGPEPVPALSPEPASTLHIGATIRREAQHSRREAQQSDLVRSLRADMLSLLDLLASPIATKATPAVPPIPAPPKTPKPRLVLEPRHTESRPAPARLHLAQRDLFPLELSKLPE